MFSMLPICVYCIIALTVAFSYQGFRDPSHEEKYIFDPYPILAGRQYFRLITSGFLHADWRHLLLNMVTLFLFGPTLEFVLGHAQFLLIYFGALVGGSLLSLYIHRHHEYRAYGASGAVCGILFSYILMFPGARIGQFYIPIAIPGWLYALLFMLGSFYGMKNHNRGNIGHDAHLGGALIGFGITAALQPEMIRLNRPVFALVLLVSLPLLVYLWKNPMFLPIDSLLPRRGSSKKARGAPPASKRSVDAILEKISSVGYESLTAAEKAELQEVSGKYQRREQSEKPRSGLTF